MTARSLRIPRLLFLTTLVFGCLAVPSTAQTTRNVRQISQYGITWTFSKDAVAGQFANGDWWVVGPVSIVSINPPSRSGSVVKHGAMVNPSPSLDLKQGYDNKVPYFDYVPALNAALDVSTSKPLVLAPHSSLVSVISRDDAVTNTKLKGCSILTVLPKAAPDGSFRPPYCGKDKTVKFNKSQLNYSLLRKLQPVGNPPSLAGLERQFQRAWLDHAHSWINRYIHPEDNMPGYGRAVSNAVEEAALYLHLNVPDTVKEKLLIGFVQVGIDLMGVVDDGGVNNWHADGGHQSGRKWPILFAGLMLNDPNMKGIGNRKVAFGEDQQTFYVRETSPGVFNNGHGGYTKAHKDMPEWGIVHAKDPASDSVAWDAPYRRCCTANVWKGFVLAARLMNAQALWNHDSLFDYMDRYIATIRAKQDPGYMLSWDPWTIAMWDRYRPQVDRPTGLSSEVRPSSQFARPAGVKAQPNTAEVRLRWDEGSSQGAKKFRIFRGTTATKLDAIGTSVDGSNRFIDPAVPRGKTYFYAIAGILPNGKDTMQSDIVTVKL